MTPKLGRLGAALIAAAMIGLAVGSCASGYAEHPPILTILARAVCDG